MNDQFNERQYKEEVQGLHAPKGTVTAAMRRAEAHVHTAHSRLRPVAAAAAVCVLLGGLGGAAYAAGWVSELQAVLTPATEGDAEALASAAFGEDGISTDPAMMVGTDGAIIALPEQERVAVEEALTDRTVGDYVSNVDAVVTIGNYTYTFQQFLLDETGTGVLYYTLSNPDGVEGWTDSGYGEIAFDWNQGDGLVEPVFSTASGQMMDASTCLLSDVSTDTELHLVAYLGAFQEDGDGYESGESILMRLGIWQENAETGELEQTETTVTFTPESYVPTVALTDGSGNAGAVSAVGLTLETLDTAPIGGIASCVIQYADGTAYTVDDEDVMNWTISYFDDDGVNYCFNRLVDTGEIASITLSVKTDTGEVVVQTFTPAD
ncbi:MAG: hypothetical protein LUC48_10895 [Clostridiales bacterium]|nr:hypothetical protein [Clostridiales bacterium]